MEGTDLNWRKSTYSSGGATNCVEVASVPETVLVRDTADRYGGALSITPRAWATFTLRLR